MVVTLTLMPSAGKLAHQLGGGLALGGHARNLDVDVLGPGSDLARLDLHGLDVVGKDLKRDGHIGDVGQDLLGKRAVVVTPPFFIRDGLVVKP